jgi:hypothetical protein
MVSSPDHSPWKIRGRRCMQPARASGMKLIVCWLSKRTAEEKKSGEWRELWMYYVVMTLPVLYQWAGGVFHFKSLWGGYSILFDSTHRNFLFPEWQIFGSVTHPILLRRLYNYAQLVVHNNTLCFNMETSLPDGLILLRNSVNLTSFHQVERVVLQIPPGGLADW